MKGVTTDITTMPMRKTAITMPEELLDAVDRAALERGESRSRFINQVLALALRSRRDAEITRRLDAFFSTEEQRTTAAREAEALDELGTEWSDEGW